MKIQEIDAAPDDSHELASADSSLFIYVLAFGCAGPSMLPTWTFSSCIEQGLLFTVMHGLLIVVVCRLSCGLQALGHRLRSCGPQV